jgi:hypothetical protein
LLWSGAFPTFSSGNTQVEFGPSLVYVPPAAEQSAEDPDACAPVALNAKKVIDVNNNKYAARDMTSSFVLVEEKPSTFH